MVMPESILHCTNMNMQSIGCAAPNGDMHDACTITHVYYVNKSSLPHWFLFNKPQISLSFSPKK